MSNRSHIRKVDLQENVGGGHGAHTTVSVLEPFLRVERTDDKYYRIIMTFTLQVKIHAFEKGYRRRNEKLFDFISLRYLYNEPEKHKVKPLADKTSELDVTEETKTTTGWKLGLTGGDSTAPVAPTVEATVQRDNTLTYARKTRSWRTGLSFEPYIKYKHPQNLIAWPGINPMACDKDHHHFQVRSRHAHGRTCHCSRETDNPKARCRYKYDKCAHWFWQTEAGAHLWTPEIYESFSEVIAITRLVPVGTIDHFIPREAKDGTNKEAEKVDKDFQGVLPYLHFDFVVTTRLRELGWKFKDYLLPASSKPTEIRAKIDYGYPLATDRVAFCVWCCPGRVETYPWRPTRELQMEADKEVAEHGSKVRKLPNDKEHYHKSKADHKLKNKEKESLRKTDEALREVNAKLAEVETKSRLERLDQEVRQSRCQIGASHGPGLDRDYSPYAHMRRHSHYVRERSRIRTRPEGEGRYSMPEEYYEPEFHHLDHRSRARSRETFPAPRRTQSQAPSLGIYSADRTPPRTHSPFRNPIHEERLPRSRSQSPPGLRREFYRSGRREKYAERSSEDLRRLREELERLMLEEQVEKTKKEIKQLKEAQAKAHQEKEKEKAEKAKRDAEEKARKEGKIGHNHASGSESTLYLSSGEENKGVGDPESEDETPPAHAEPTQYPELETHHHHHNHQQQTPIQHLPRPARVLSDVFGQRRSHHHRHPSHHDHQNTRSRSPIIIVEDSRRGVGEPAPPNRSPRPEMHHRSATGSRRSRSMDERIVEYVVELPIRRRPGRRSRESASLIDN